MIPQRQIFRDRQLMPYLQICPVSHCNALNEDLIVLLWHLQPYNVACHPFVIIQHSNAEIIFLARFELPVEIAAVIAIAGFYLGAGRVSIGNIGKITVLRILRSGIVFCN